MSRPLCLLILAALAQPARAQDTPASVIPGTEGFDRRTIISGLEGPWEVTLAPDGMLWVTERTAGRISRVDPATGAQTVAITLEDVEAPGGQDGLLGMALHPGLGTGTGQDYVFAAYTYLDPNRAPDQSVVEEDSPYRHLYTKIVRLTYAPETGALSDPMELITGMPASNDHNSGRMQIGPDEKLYYTIGDQGNNQLGNWCIPIQAQRLPTRDEVEDKDWAAYVGKSLRMELDGAIPADNPEFDGIRSHVFTYGHRNMQGIAFGPQGHLFASEQGPKTDDELNILTAGGNYGWPNVAGYPDDKAYAYARWADSAPTPCADLTFSDLEIPAGVPFARESDWPAPPDFTPPIGTMFTVPDDWNFADPACGGVDFICWPTIAASSIEVYAPEGAGIPGWKDSLIIPTLKRGSLYRVKLSDDGTSLKDGFIRYFQSENRFRDTAISPDGLTIYVATDPGGVTEAAGGGTTTQMADPGAILAFTYNPAAKDGTPAQTENTETGTTQSGDNQETAATTDQPTGQFYPPTFTAEQVAAGKTAFNGACAQCHGNTLANGTMGPPLAGRFFDTRWHGQSVAELYGASHDRMPPSRPGALPDESYAAITAYILSINGFDAGQTPLPPDRDALANMQIALPEQ